MGVPVFLPQRRQVALELEATEGTGETIVDADVLAPIFEPDWTPNFEVPEREVVQPSFSRIARVPAERSATVVFALELKGSGTAGTAPAHLSDPFQSCGMSETIVASVSVTYAPVSSGDSSATIELFEGATDGTIKIHRIIGARGTFTIEAVKGLPVLVRFEFTGRYVEPTEGSFLTAPSIGTVPIAFLGAAFSFQAVATLRIQNATIDIANTVVMRNDANQATGNFSGVITSRLPIGSIDPEQVLIAEKNFFSDLTAGTEGVLSYVLGTVAGNITTINAPKAQIVGIAPADRDAIRTEGIDLQFNQNVVAGDDEFTIAFT